MCATNSLYEKLREMDEARKENNISLEEKRHVIIDYQVIKELRDLIEKSGIITPIAPTD